MFICLLIHWDHLCLDEFAYPIRLSRGGFREGHLQHTMWCDTIQGLKRRKNRKRGLSANACFRKRIASCFSPVIRDQYIGWLCPVYRSATFVHEKSCRIILFISFFPSSIKREKKKEVLEWILIIGAAYYCNQGRN